MVAVQIGTGGPGTRAALAELRQHGAADPHLLPADADKSTVDDLLSTLDDHQRIVVIAGDLAGLSRLVLRMLRRGLLGRHEVAAIVDSPQWTDLVRLPRGPAAQALVAATGSAEPLGLVRDDQGGIVLAGAEMWPDEARRFGVRAYVEDVLLVDERVRAITVRPAGTGLRAAAEVGLGRHRVVHGRAVTLSCEPARVRIDGVPLPNPRRRATFWYHPDCWQLVRGG
jgi:hypothetical protein